MTNTTQVIRPIATDGKISAVEMIVALIASGINLGRIALFKTLTDTEVELLWARLGMKRCRFTAEFVREIGAGPEVASQIMAVQETLPNGRVNVCYRWQGNVSYRTYAARDLHIIEDGE
jgi:hypothetical protein